MSSPRPPSLAPSDTRPRLVERYAALLRDLRQEARVEGSAYVQHEERMLSHLEALSRHQDRCFEPSLAWTGDRWSLYRYSYSFHDTAPARWRGDLDTLLEWVALLSPESVGTAERLLRLVRPPLATQLLFGLDADPTSAPRLKIYFRLTEGRAYAKAPLLTQLLPDVPEPALPEVSALHLVGADFGPLGVTTLKLYALATQVPAKRLERELADSPHRSLLITSDAPARWWDVVYVAKVPSDRRHERKPFTALHLNAERNGITWGGILTRMETLRSPPPLEAPRRLEARHAPLLSRLTVSMIPSDALTLYFRLP